MKFTHSISPLSSISTIKTFLPFELDLGFKKWINYGLNFIHQFIRKGHFKSFEQLQREFNLPKVDFYRYLQIRDFITKHKDWEGIANPNKIEKILMNIRMGNTDKRVISKLYQSMLTGHSTLRFIKNDGRLKHNRRSLKRIGQIYV